MQKKIVERLKEIGLKKVLCIGGSFLAMIFLANIITANANANNANDSEKAVAPTIEVKQKLDNKEKDSNVEVTIVPSSQEVNSMDSRKNYVPHTSYLIKNSAKDLLVKNYVVSFDKDGNNLGACVAVDGLPNSKFGNIEYKEYHGISSEGASSEDWLDALRDINVSLVRKSKDLNLPRIALNLATGTYYDCGITYQSLENVQSELTFEEHSIVSYFFRDGIKGYYTNEVDYFVVKNDTVLKATEFEHELLETLEKKLRTVHIWLGLKGDTEAYRAFYKAEDTNQGPDRSILKLDSVIDIKANKFIEPNIDNSSLKESKN